MQVERADSVDGRKLYRRYTTAKCNWDLWRSIYDEAYAFAIPQRDPWPDDSVEGRRKNIQVYDITAVNSCRRLVTRLQNSLVPPGEQWFALEAGDAVVDPAQKKLLNMYLQGFTDIIFKAINDSNFSLVIQEFFQDVIIGTGSMMILPSDGKSPIRFKSTGVNVVYPEPDVFDEINTVWRDFNDVYIRDIQTMWPKAKILPDMQLKLDMDPMAQTQLVEGVVYYPETKDYRIVLMTQDTTEYLMDIRKKSTPWVVSRWSKCTNEVGGRGPVIEALPTIRSLNVLVEEIMRNVALSTSPPWIAASDGVFNPYLFQIEPNKIIPVSRQSMNGMPLQRLDVASDISMGNLEINDLRAQIKDALFDNPTRPINAPKQTATEVMVRQQEFKEDVSSFGRLAVEFLPKTVERIVFILQEKGQLPRDLQIDHKNIVIQYKSPLVRSASLQKIENLQNYVAILQPILGPELTLGSLNIDKLPEWLADKLDVDETLIKSSEEVKEMVANLMNQMNPPSDAQQLPPPNKPLANQVNAQQALGAPNG